MASIVTGRANLLLLLILLGGITVANVGTFFANPTNLSLSPPAEVVVANSLAPVIVTMPAGVQLQSNHLTFTPANITVVIGVNNTIAWKNMDSVSHTASSNPGDPMVFDTGLVSPGMTSTPVTLTVPGTYGYHCNVHPIWMHGTIIVLLNTVSTTSTSTSTTAVTTTIVSMFVSYSVIGGGTPSAPIFHYVLNGGAKSLTLSTSSKPVSIDPGTTWSVTPNPLGGSTSSQRWYSNQPLTGAASATEPKLVSETTTTTTTTTTTSTMLSTSIVFVFYRQTLQKLSYSVVGGGSVYTAPTFEASQFGSPFPVTLTNAPTSYWYDYGSSWTVTPNPLSGSSTSERWFTIQKSSGTLTASSTYAFKYQHQFFLTMQLAPFGNGTVSPSNNWFNAAKKVPIKATAKTGYKLIAWAGIGGGSYSGPSSSPTIMVNAPITETANFGVIITITSNPTGSGYVMIDAQKKPVKTPVTFVWQSGSTHNITAVSPVGCSAGCQYVFATWSDGGARSHIIIVPGSPATFTAFFQKQFYLTLNVIPSGAGTINQTNGWFNAGAKVILTATANSGHTFKSWKGAGTGSYTGSNNSTTITMNSAITETANFT